MQRVVHHGIQLLWLFYRVMDGGSGVSLAFGCFCNGLLNMFSCPSGSDLMAIEGKVEVGNWGEGDRIGSQEGQDWGDSRGKGRGCVQGGL